MKRILFVLTATLWSLLSQAQVINPPAQVPSGAQALTQLLGPAFQQPYFTSSPNSLVVTYSAGNVFAGSGAVPISQGSLTMTASEASCGRPAVSACNFIYWTAGSSLSVTTNFQTATANGNVLLALVATGSSGVNTLEALYQDGAGAPPNYSVTDGQFTVPLNSCYFLSTVALGAAPTGTTNPGFVRVAAGNIFYELVGSANSGSYSLDCPIQPPLSRNSSGKGVTINSVNVCYGLQGAALSSAPSIGFSTQSVGAIAAAASAPTTAAAGGVITTSPASLPTATTTAQQCETVSATLGTPFNLGSLGTPSLAQLVMEMNFAASATATTVQIGQIQVFYTITQ